MHRFAVREYISFTNRGGVGLFKESLATIEIILIKPPRVLGLAIPFYGSARYLLTRGPGMLWKFNKIHNGQPGFHYVH